MTVLLGDGRFSVQPLTWASGASGPEAAPARDPVIDALEHDVAELRAALEKARADMERAIEDAHEAGRKQAETALARDEAQRIALLEAALIDQVASLRARTDGLDALALLVCETALEHVLADPNAYRDLICRSIAVQLGALRREMVLAVHVSGEDFPDAEALREVQRRIGDGIAKIVADEALGAGACRIDLRLGHIEISVPRYWSELQARLRDAAEAPP